MQSWPDHLEEKIYGDYQSVSETSFPLSVRPTLRHIWPQFTSHSPLRRVHLAPISHKAGRTSGRRYVSDMLWDKPACNRQRFEAHCSSSHADRSHRHRSSERQYFLLALPRDWEAVLSAVLLFAGRGIYVYKGWEEIRKAAFAVRASLRDTV